VQEYLKLGNATEAAKRAGYAEKSAAVQGCRLLRDDNIRAQIETLRSKVEDKASVTLAEVVEAIRNAAFLDVATLYDEQGNIRPLSELPLEVRRAVVGIKSTTFNQAGGDGVQERVADLRLVPKDKALDMLMRHLGGYVERHEVSFSGDMVELLLQGRQRARGRGKAD